MGRTLGVGVESSIRLAFSILMGCPCNEANLLSDTLSGLVKPCKVPGKDTSTLELSAGALANIIASTLSERAGIHIDGYALYATSAGMAAG